MERKRIVIGNWKMNHSIQETKDFVEKVQNLAKDNASIEVGIAPQALALGQAIDLAEGTGLLVGAQDTHTEDSGSYTGEISPASIKAAGADFVIVGHSERRQYFNETDELVNDKAHAVLNHHMLPVICIGETEDERNNDQTETVIKKQVTAALKDISETDLEKVVVAYEPVWAIGSGQAASAKEANDVIKFVRKTIADLYSQEKADQVRIQYGGSVKPDNIGEFLSQSDIDGALVGGASLEVDSFTALINAASK